MEEKIDSLVTLAVEYAPKLVLAIITLIIGLWVIGSIVRGLKNFMIKRNTDPSLVPFLSSLVSTLLKIMLIISIASMVGIATTSFVAVIGAAGLAIGLALQGSLSNFAGGVMLLLFKPFKVGDYITAQSHSGTVKEIQIFHTILKTPDNKTIILANGPVAGGSIVNFSTEPRRRVDFTFGIGYGDDIKKAKDILLQIITGDERVLKEPAPFVAVGNLGDSSVDFTVRVWCEAGNFWGIHFDTIEKVKLTFDKEGISIPFPQRDIHYIPKEVANMN